MGEQLQREPLRASVVLTERERERERERGRERKVTLCFLTSSSSSSLFFSSFFFPREREVMSIIAATDKDGRRSGPVLLPIAAKPGPISPGHCKLLPPGIGRATAGIPFSVTLQTFDANERKIYEGGARVKLKAVRELLPQVEKNAAAGAATATATATATAGGGGDIIEGTVRDHRDGSYGLTLSV